MCTPSITSKSKPVSMHPHDAALEENDINAKPGFAMMPDECNVFREESGEGEASYYTFHTAIQNDFSDHLEELCGDLEEVSKACDSSLQDNIPVPNFLPPVGWSFPPSDATFWGLNHRDAGHRKTFALEFVDSSKSSVAELVKSLRAKQVAPDPPVPLPLHEPLPWRGVRVEEAHGRDYAEDSASGPQRDGLGDSGPGQVEV